MSRVMLCIGALCASAPAAAAWHKASNAHFVIYADESPAKLRKFGTRLEKFDRAVRYVRGMADPPMGDGNRLTVFVVPTVEDVRKLAAHRTGLTPNLQGFYTGRAEGSVAIVPKQSNDTKMGDLADEAQVRDTGRPTANGIAALHYASDLARQDLGLRAQSAFQYLRDGKLAEARKALAPIAFDPHGGGYAKMARAAMKRIDAGDGKGAQEAMRAGN